MFSLLRQISSCISQEAAFYSKVATAIPGLHVYQNFLEADAKCSLQKEAIQLHHAISTDAAGGSVRRGKTYLSKYQNLKSDEYYRLVKVDDGEAELQCQYFERYGEDGHQLTYFIGNSNLPSFIKSQLIPRVLEIPEVVALTQSKPLNWNFTFNTYTSTANQSARIAGFDFHKDVASNGEATMIYSMGAQSKFHIRLPSEADKIHAFALQPNSLILLSREARWDYEHCVVPVEIADSLPLFASEVETIWRTSLVLGFVHN